MIRIALLIILSFSAANAVEQVEWVAQLGGTLQRNAENQIIGLNLRATWVSDADLAEVAKWKHLERIDLSLTRITDQGLQLLKAFCGDCCVIEIEQLQSFHLL